MSNPKPDLDSRPLLVHVPRRQWRWVTDWRVWLLLAIAALLSAGMWALVHHYWAVTPMVVAVVVVVVGGRWKREVAEAEAARLQQGRRQSRVEELLASMPLLVGNLKGDENRDLIHRAQEALRWLRECRSRHDTAEWYCRKYLSMSLCPVDEEQPVGGVNRDAYFRLTSFSPGDHEPLVFRCMGEFAAQVQRCEDELPA